MDAHETVLKAYKYFGEADIENWRLYTMTIMYFTWMEYTDCLASITVWGLGIKLFSKNSSGITQF